MSRGSDDAPKPVVPKHADEPRGGHQTPPRHETIAPTKMPQGPNGEDAVTREEMVKLFGGALRVR